MRALFAGGSLAAIAVVLVAMIGSASSAAQGGAGGELRPDLVTQPFGHDLVLKTGPEHARLRLGNTIANRGAGPLEIFPQEGTENCDPSSQGSDRFAYQRIFEDDDSGGGDGVFRRKQDTGSASVQAGCMAYHPAHNHWHFDDFSQYRLRRQANGRVVAESTKVSFCVVDTFPTFSDLPGSPNDGYYPSGGSTCDAEAIEGISIGWSDTYGSSLPGQALDVTGIPKGRYCLISMADPSDRLVETDDSNNERHRLLSLNVATGRLARVPGDC